MQCCTARIGIRAFSQKMQHSRTANTILSLVVRLTVFILQKVLARWMEVLSHEFVLFGTQLKIFENHF